MLIASHRKRGIWITALCANHATPMIHGASIPQSISWIFTNYSGGINHFARQQDSELDDISRATAREDLN
jgi:hypothetical protein